MLCTEPELISARYGIPAARLRWFRPEVHQQPGLSGKARKALLTGLGLGVDAARMAGWVRRVLWTRLYPGQPGPFRPVYEPTASVRA